MKLSWSDLDLFVHVARGGGLARASEATGQSPPTLSRRMRVLERSLGLTLFRRHARGYDLTPSGELLLEQAERVEALVQDIQSSIGGPGNALPVQISAGTWMSRFLAQHMHVLLATRVRLSLLWSDSRLDIGRREALIGLRNRRPTEVGLAGRRVAQIAFASYAVPDMSDADWIAYSGSTPSADWVRRHHGQSVRLEVNHPRLLLDLARAGQGNVVLPCFVGDAEEKLVRTSPVIDELTHDQWLVTHDEDRKLPEVRAVIDAIVGVLMAEGPRLAGERPSAAS